MWFRRRKHSDFQAEIEAHIDLEQQRLMAQGMSASEAKAAARRCFGNAAVVQERYYESQRWMWVSHLARDLRHGWLLLRKSPAFTMAASITIALCVGANTAVFRLVDAVLLQPLAVKAPHELVFVESAGTTLPAAPPYPCLARLADGTGPFTGLAVFATDEMRVEIDGRPEPVFGQAASANYFDVLGVKAKIGRLMEGRDGKLDPPLAVISDGYWQRRFNRDPGVRGKPITIGGRVYLIAGVIAADFRGLEPGRPVDVTIPIDTAGGIQTYAGPWWFDVVARLKPAVRASSAEAAANVAFQACMGDADARAAGLLRLELAPAAHGAGTLRERFSGPLLALTGIGAAVLLLATVNIATLLLVRGIGRSREFAIRLAVGAGRVHLVRQLLTETVLLFGLGAAPGVFLADWAVGMVTALFAEGRRPITLETSWNWHVVAFSIAVTLTAALLASLFPVWRVLRADAQQEIKAGQSRVSESRGTATLMRGLVGFQVALSLVLLAGAISFTRTLVNLRHVDLGFRNEEVLTMSVELPESWKSGESAEAWSRVLGAVRGMPGVGNAALCVFTPLSGRDSGATPVEIRGDERSRLVDRTVRVNHVSEGYFETLGIRLVRGRLLSERDREGALKVAVINEATARYFFGDRDALGKMLEFPRKGAPATVYQIIGVVGDTTHRNLRETSARFVYISVRQPLDSYRRLTLAVAASGDALAPLRRELAGVDPGLLISEVITLRRQMDSTLLTERLLSGLSAAFGVLALILASVGLYGVLSYRVGQQRHSIGIQMALGAAPASVALGVLRQSAKVIGLGVAWGLPFALLAARAADSLLWGVESSDPTTYLVAAATLCLVGLASAWFPARRAAAIEPAEALRHG